MRSASTFELGVWTVTPALNLLERNGDSIKIEPRSMDVLVCLAERAPELVSTDELVDTVWQDRIVSDSSVYQVINQLRKAFAPDAAALIETVPKRGYRLTAPVKFTSGPSESVTRSPRLMGWRRRAAAALGVVLVTAAASLVWRWALTPFELMSGPPTIAVMPFENLSGNEADDYLGEGIAEEIIYALSSDPGLRVIARTSSFSFADGSSDVAEIAERLNADLILEGSVRRENGNMRVIAQLVDAADHSYVWSDSFDLRLEELLPVEREIAVAVARQLMGDEAGESQIAAALPALANLSAYEYFLLGRQRMHNPTGLTRDWPLAEADRAIQYFRRAIMLDPTFARAHANLATALLLKTAAESGRFWAGGASITDAVRTEVAASLDRALALNPNLAEGHLARGIAFAVIERDRERSFEQYRRAIELDPNFVDALYYLGKGVQGEEGARALRAALDLDPLSSELSSWLHRILYSPAYRGHPEESVRLFEAMVEDPNFERERAQLTVNLARSYLDLGDFDAAEALLAPHSAGDNRSPNLRIHLAIARGEYEVVSALVKGWVPDSPRDQALLGLYEMVIGHDNHSIARYESEIASVDPPTQDNFISWGYLPAVNFAHLLARRGDRENVQRLLRDSRRVLEEIIDASLPEGDAAYYVLASIFAIEGDTEAALDTLETAIQSGWTKHWFMPHDPNLVYIRDEPRFKAMVANLRAEMGLRRETL